jgi:hypothetical protein
MKLKATDWKQPWFESHISERFFQEMARLEKGTTLGLQTSGEWAQQVMIDVGALAQTMMRLESDGVPEPQIRQAGEKALRLAALALHLVTALDGADREQLRSSTLVRTERGEWVGGRPPLPLPHSGEGAAPLAPGSSTSAHTPAPEFAPLAHAAALHPGVLRPGVLNSNALRPGMQQPTPPPGEADAPGGASPETDVGTAHPAAALVSSLLEVAGRPPMGGESRMRHTIVSLAQQGLSRAEIEMVTGEPRHVIEAVLNHERAAIQAGGQAG